MTTIHTTVTTTVYLGQNNTSNTLLITDMGSVTPTAYGAAGIVTGSQRAHITNLGSVTGGYGGKTGYADGGVGIALAHGGRLINAGTIRGGLSAYSDYNSAHKYAESNAGDGVTGTGVNLVNTGSIYGGLGLYTKYGYHGGGTAVDLSGGTIVNQGKIAGGSCANGGTLGAGLQIAGGQLMNAGIITGGSAGGGYSYDYNGGRGGTGVSVSGRTIITNTGTIAGGTGFSAEFGGGGGFGVNLGAGVLKNQGTILGGDGAGGRYSGGGGDGVAIAGGSLTNAGLIIGGIAGGPEGHYSGTGGVGVFMQSGKISNFGTIISLSQSFGGDDSGAPGPGLSMISGLTENFGLIATTGASPNNPNYPYIGVEVGGGTLSNFGTIAGGLDNGVFVGGDAVTFGANAATLIVHAHSVFKGDVVANSVNDTLVLGAGGGTLTGLGSNFTGFVAINEVSGGTWTLAGAAILTANANLNAAGALGLSGAVTGGGTLTLGTGANVTAQSGLAVTDIIFAAGGGESLTLADSAGTTGTLTGFSSSDTIDLVNLIANGASFANGTLSLLDDGHAVGQLILAGSYATADFSVVSDGSGGTDLLVDTPAVSAAPDWSPHWTPLLTAAESIPAFLTLHWHGLA